MAVLVDVQLLVAVVGAGVVVRGLGGSCAGVGWWVEALV